MQFATEMPNSYSQSRIWLSSPHMSGNEIKYINEAFERNQVFPLGPNVDGLEEDIKSLTGVPYCTCLVSGTSAIHTALIILGVSHGDEVICSSFTFSASANPIVYQGAMPVFIDSENDTWNMCPRLLETAIQERISKGKKPKAIILVHLYGMPAQIDPIMTIANRYQIPVIEDAAESFGSTYLGNYTGTFGEIGIYSFNGNKVITTSGGGALISKNEHHCKKALFLATQARDKAPHYQHSQIGYNYRMSNISAGIGRGQMSVLKERIEQRRANWFFYRQALKEFAGITFQTEPDNRYFSNHWLTTILVDPDKCNGINREDIRLKLEEYNIESRPLWKPMHLQPVFKDYLFYINGTSEKMFATGLCLPSSSNITDDERNRVAENIINILRQKK